MAEEWNTSSRATDAYGNCTKARHPREQIGCPHGQLLYYKVRLIGFIMITKHQYKCPYKESGDRYIVSDAGKARKRQYCDRQKKGGL